MQIQGNQSDSYHFEGAVVSGLLESQKEFLSFVNNDLQAVLFLTFE